MNIPKIDPKDINVETIIRTTLKFPIVKVNRASFLTKILRANYSQEIIDTAIDYSPAYANIPLNYIDKKAKNIIKYETNKVTAISTITGIPGGIAAIGGVTIDTAQYFTFILRVMQKLAYLYSFPDFELQEDNIQEETLNEILLFMGVMFGTNGATKGLQMFAATLGKYLEKEIPKKALSKTVWYPVTKTTLKKLGYNITKNSVGKAAGKAIPILGGVLSGGLSYVTFKPCCYRLKSELEKLDICDPNSDIYKKPTIE